MFGAFKRRQSRRLQINPRQPQHTPVDRSPYRACAGTQTRRARPPRTPSGCRCRGGSAGDKPGQKKNSVAAEYASSYAVTDSCCGRYATSTQGSQPGQCRTSQHSPSCAASKPTATPTSPRRYAPTGTNTRARQRTAPLAILLASPKPTHDPVTNQHVQHVRVLQGGARCYRRLHTDSYTGINSHA